MFIVGLSIVGTFVAGVHYSAIDLPEQKTLAASSNNLEWPHAACAACAEECEPCRTLNIGCMPDCKEGCYTRCDDPAYPGS